MTTDLIAALLGGLSALSLPACTTVRTERFEHSEIAERISDDVSDTADAEPTGAFCYKFSCSENGISQSTGKKCFQTKEEDCASLLKETACLGSVAKLVEQLHCPKP